MYTLEHLQQKSLKELKEIGWELNVLPESDRRRRESWINAIAGVNPPLLQLLEVSPGVEVDRVQEPIIETVETSPAADNVQAQEPPIESKFGRIVYPRPAQGAITQAAENSSGVESVEPTQKAPEHKFLLCLKDGDNTLWYDGKDFVLEKWSAKTYCKRGVGAAKHQLRSHPEVKRVRNVPQVVENSPPVQVESIEVQRQEPIAQAAQNSPGVEVDQLPECVECFGDGYFEDKSGLIKFCQCSASEPTLSCQITQRAIVPASKNLPGSRSKTTAHQLLELFKSSAHIIEDSPGVKTEATVSESAIAPATKNRIKEESDQNPILTGIPLSDKFVTRYTPPQSEIIHFQSDADGQLSLLNFEVESVEEPPDPDDFESLDAFREAIAIWDEQNESNSVHCEHSFVHSEPNSVHCEHSFVHSEPNSVYCQPPDPHDFDSMFAFWAAYDVWDEASDDDSEPLGISLDSFCEWAPCPEDWYEPHTLLEPSKVMELSPVRKSSITSDFFIPTFDRWGDRSNRSDEPPDTGIFARLPKPKPPTFPPQAASWTQVGRKSAQLSPIQPKSARYPEAIPKLSRNYPETIPKLFHRVVACSTLPARSPPGGDASF